MAHAGEWMGSVIGENPATSEPMVYQVVRCELCILTHIWPLPSEEALAQFYARRFYQTVAADEVARHERDRAWEEACVYGPFLAACERSLPQAKARHRLLDIGAGCGIGLATASKRGWMAYGIEPDDALCTHMRGEGHVIAQGALAGNIAFAFHASPDVVLLHEMLEHQVNPEAFLLDCYDVMQPGALLAISVPNDFSPLQMAVCAKYTIPYYWLIPPVHTHYFTPKTLQLVIRRCGFTILDMRGTYPLEHVMVQEDGQCYVGNSALWRTYNDEKIAHELLDVREGRWQEREAQYRDNLRDRIGRSIICIARKD
jgi:2-polyprenyl-3-methyl-5-hydroxy-6-metoxy-1,4-benzoquinol methylase